jgi:phospholipase C
LERDEFIQAIHKAQFKNPPANFRRVTDAELEQLKGDRNKGMLAEQEKGTRKANALPYELNVDGKLNADKKLFRISLKAGNKLHGAKSAGAPFNIYSGSMYEGENVKTWSYAVRAGDTVHDSWPLEKFNDEGYHLKVYGPNGFYREFKGTGTDPAIEVLCHYFKGSLKVSVKNEGNTPVNVSVADNAYGGGPVTIRVGASTTGSALVDVSRSHGWYDISVVSDDNNSFMQIFAGRLEDGKPGRTDPLMGREVD